MVFSIVDVIGILTEQPDYDGARNYWKVMKKRLFDEGSELVTNCNQLKMKSPKDGKIWAVFCTGTCEYHASERFAVVASRQREAISANSR